MELRDGRQDSMARTSRDWLMGWTIVDLAFGEDKEAIGATAEMTLEWDRWEGEEGRRRVKNAENRAVNMDEGQGFVWM